MRLSGVDVPYNLRLGPVKIRTEADITANFNDNINYAQTGRQTDVILTPSTELYGDWKVSDLNTIKFNLGVGYEAYLLHSQYNSVLLTPDSNISLNFFVGDVVVNVHEGLSYQQDPASIGQLSNTVRLSRFENDVGASATWDLDDIILELGYDHFNLWVTQSAYSYLSNASDTVTPKVTIKLDKSISTGVEISASSITYQQGFQNDYDTLSVGPFVNAQISDNLALLGEAGYYLADYAQGGGNGDAQNASSYYFNAGVSHRLNQDIKETLVAGREFIPGLTSNFTQRIYANYTVSWLVNHSIGTGGNLFWENLDDSDATFSERSNRYGVGVYGEYYLSTHATVNLNYQYTIKDANPSSESYYQNSFSMGLQYNF